MPTVAEKRAQFRALHREGCFLLPNPWDAGSARWLQHAGFKALATTSSGAAHALALPDQAMSLEQTLANIEAICSVTDLPVNADFGNAFADMPEGVGGNVGRCLATGAAGVSVEDQLPGTSDLYERALAVERVAAARAAVDAEGGGAVLVARTECFLTGHPGPLDEALARLAAFAAAGADCLYAPGVRSREDIAALVAAVAPKPLNLLVGRPIGLTVAEIAELGVRRISLGGALAKAAWAGFMKVAAGIAASGRFDGLAAGAEAGDLDAFFAAGRSGT